MFCCNCAATLTRGVGVARGGVEPPPPPTARRPHEGNPSSRILNHASTAPGVATRRQGHADCSSRPDRAAHSVLHAEPSAIDAGAGPRPGARGDVARTRRGGGIWYCAGPCRTRGTAARWPSPRRAGGVWRRYPQRRGVHRKSSGYAACIRAPAGCSVFAAAEPTSGRPRGSLRWRPHGLPRVPCLQLRPAPFRIAPSHPSSIQVPAVRRTAARGSLAPPRFASLPVDCPAPGTTRSWSRARAPETRLKQCWNCVCAPSALRSRSSGGLRC